MTDLHNPLSCWIITEGIAGTENQCLGVAEALGVSPVVKWVSLAQPWKTLSPYLGFEGRNSFIPPLDGPWPRLLITSGRKAVAVSRYIRKASGGKTFTVHIQDPRIAPSNFDLLAVPTHDPARGKNVITTIAAPNRITAEKLATAREQFRSFESLPCPRVAVLIGGTSKAYTMTPAIMRKLAVQLKSLQAGLMITASRRTGAENESILRENLKGLSNVMIWDGTGENPYIGMLAWADFILVTADSVSMLSEAATTGKPVYMIPLEGGGHRLDKLHENLITLGAVRPFDGRLECWDYEPLNDASLVAKAVEDRL